MSSKTILFCIARGSFPGKRIFLGGRGGGSECFWESVLNECALLTRAEFQKVTQGATVPRRMTVVLYTTSIVPGSLIVVSYTTVNLPGSLTVVYLYRRHYPKEMGMVARSEACLLGMQAAPSSNPTSGTFCRGDLVMKHFYGHSPSSTDSRRAVVSCWRKNVH